MYMKFFPSNEDLFCLTTVQVEKPHQRNDDLLCDFCDGDMFQEHPLFGADPYALQVIVYFDELEVCNPLGSRATKHKIGKN